MKTVCLVALGGALGSVARYKLSGLIMRHALDWRFPIGTFIVNILGCFVIGILGGLVVKANLFSANTRYFLFTGILGGFTTFSSFGLETFHLLRKGELLVAGANIVLSIILGLLVLWLGFYLVQLLDITKLNRKLAWLSLLLVNLGKS